MVLVIYPTYTEWPKSPSSSTHTSRLASSRTRTSADRGYRDLPIGLEVTLHLGTLEDLTLVRFDNAHEDTKGHEHHTAAGDIDGVTFPGMEERLVGFWASADEYWDAVGGDPPRPY